MDLEGTYAAATSLTVRDYIATKLAVGLLETKPTSSPADRKWLAERAYELADAMLSARRKGPRDGT